MHPLESQLAELLQSGAAPAVSDLGGATALAESAELLAACPMMPEFLRLAVDALGSADGPEFADLSRFIRASVDSACDGMAYAEMVDILDGARPLPDGLEEACFEGFLASTTDGSKEPIARASALDGALRWAAKARRRQFKLFGMLLDIPRTEQPVFLSRTARILGVCYSLWREEELVEKLSELSTVEGARGQARHELGMVELIRGIEETERIAAVAHFEAARGWFGAVDEPSALPEAQAYTLALDLLLSFYKGEGVAELEETRQKLSLASFRLQAWHLSDDDPPWLGSRLVESFYWKLLADRLVGLADNLNATTWYEPAQVVEQYVLACLVASRSIFRRPVGGGVDALVSPRIVSGLTRTFGHADLLRKWISRNATHEWASAAAELSAQLDELIQGGATPRPDPAAPVWPPVAALLNGANLPGDVKASALTALRHLFEVQYAATSEAELEVLTRCLDVVSASEDWRNNGPGRKLFDAVLLATVRFVSNRLSMTRMNDRYVQYLFEQTPLPHENELQADYHRYMHSGLAGTEIEVSDVSGGRADVRFTHESARLVVEIKRELVDASFDRLREAYSNQATEYQNTNVRLGLLLVLDLSRPLVHGTPHLADLFEASAVVRQGERTPRWLVTVVMPGRRYRPNELRS